MAFILGKVRVFKELCHSCGGCQIICPVNAIEETDKELGIIKHGFYEETEVFSGEMKVGEESGVSIIKALLRKVKQTNKTIFIDSPPGNGCSVMESISDADYCLIVAEPSIFGLHNLNMVYTLAKTFNKRIGLIINKSTEDGIIRNYAKQNEIKIIAEIPMDLELARINSRGDLVVKDDRYRPLFETILETLVKEV